MDWGTVHIQITGANMPGTFKQLCDSGVVLRDVQFDNILCVRAQVSYRDYIRLHNQLKNKNDTVSVLRVDGIFVFLKLLIKRPVLVVLILAIILLSLWIPTRVLFVRVQGNQQIQTTRILQEAEGCGICFGAKRSAVRSEFVKNSLLETMPELQWVGVNTKGCVAVIVVREDISQKKGDEAIAFSNIVADRDGIVISAIITSGSPTCAAGDAVKKDQILVSGWQDLGMIIKTTRAVGEIVAQTEREIELISPLKYKQSGSLKGNENKYNLVIGKNRINLSKGSGISYTGCDKIYTRYYLTLPGGFVLPLAFEAERTTMYNTVDFEQARETIEILMSDQADKYLLEQTVSGVIQERQLLFTSGDGIGRTFANYTCVEMIGREHTGEINIHYGKNDGTNR